MIHICYCRWCRTETFNVLRLWKSPVAEIALDKKIRRDILVFNV